MAPLRAFCSVAEAATWENASTQESTPVGHFAFVQLFSVLCGRQLDYSVWFMMLPFALKVVWFALCVIGTISAWVTLFAFARAVGSYWGPMFYCIALTLMQSAICFGKPTTFRTQNTAHPKLRQE